MNEDISDILDNHALWLSDPSQGTRGRISMRDITGYDFSNIDLRKFIIRQSDITNCNFSNANCEGGIFLNNRGINVQFYGANLTDSDWEVPGDISGFNMAGSTWGGQILKTNPIRWSADGYEVMQTDIYAQISCQKHTIEEWLSFTDYERLTFDKKNPQKAIDWWNANNQTLRDYVKQYAR